MKVSLKTLPLMLALLLAPTAAFAQMSAAHDSNKPIEITADSLEVMQDAQQAVFSGNVVAVQGDMKINSDKMTVHYRTSADQSAKSTDAQGISKIIVDGSVLLATPAESARSRKGTYDVDQSMITLEGDVVLSRGENVVKGAFLKYDLTSGKSQIVGSGEATGSDASSDTGGKKGRVRGLFVPEKK